MNNMKKRDLELYLHIPFCVKKCNYCDFFSAAGSREEQEAYVQAMIQEIRGYKDSLHSYEGKTVFLGGGTPSLLSERQAEELFQSLYDSFTIQKDAEITMEVNPGTVNLEKLKQYKAVGVNRLSLGYSQPGMKNCKDWEEYTRMKISLLRGTLQKRQDLRTGILI